MPRRPATVTQSDVARVIRAAKQARAHSVELRIGETSIVVHLESSTGQETPLEQSVGVEL
jgi:hypothetical protein